MSRSNINTLLSKTNTNPKTATAVVTSKKDKSASEAERKVSIARNLQNTIIKTVTYMNPSVLLAIIIIVGILLVGIIIWQIVLSTHVDTSQDQKVPIVTDPNAVINITDKRTINATGIVLAFTLLVCVVIYLIPKSKTSREVEKVAAKQSHAAESSMDVDSTFFSPSLKAVLMRQVRPGKDMESVLDDIFEREDWLTLNNSCQTANTSDNGIIYHLYGVKRARVCSSPPSDDPEKYLSKPASVNEGAKWSDEVPNVSTGGNVFGFALFEIGYASLYNAPIKVYSPRAHPLSYSFINPFHIVTEDLGRFIFVGKGDTKACMVAAMIAHAHVGKKYGNSAALTGPYLIDSIHKGVGLFTPELSEPISFTIVHQVPKATSSTAEPQFVDIVQAGILVASVYSFQGKCITQCTPFAQEPFKLKLFGSYEEKDHTKPRFFRFTVLPQDTLLLYTNTVAFNLFHSAIALQPRAAHVAAKTALLLTKFSLSVHIPYYAQTQEQEEEVKGPSAPIVSEHCPEIFVLSRLIK